MFAARADQENFVYGQQTAAAAKPLNQGLGAKTPSNKVPKTPFRRNLNDENEAFGGTGLKTGKKGNENLFTKSKKTIDADNNAFVTPAAPRNRAPLGAKTTNAKGGFLKTPAPLNAGKESAQKTVSPRLRRAKVKIHQAETVNITEQDVEPEIEYMPPRSIPLCEDPDDYEPLNLDMLKPENLTVGWYSTFMNSVDSSGKTRLNREADANDLRARKISDEISSRALANDPYLSFNLTQARAELATRTKKSTVVTPSTLSAKHAAAALSRPTSFSAAPLPRFAAPTATAAARARAPLSTPVSRKPAVSQHAAATIASRSTLGYSKGRAVSGAAKRVESSGGEEEKRKSSAAVLARQVDLLEILLGDGGGSGDLLVDREGEGDLVGEMERMGVEESGSVEEDEEIRDFQFEIPDET